MFNFMKKKDTIVALATNSGYSGIGIIRISGPAVFLVIKKYIKGIVKKKIINYVTFLNISGHPLDQGIALLFLAPKSFTGEDVLEYHGHGNPILLNLLINQILSIPGIRLALPGEFSERAFLNGKIDLVQAEAISDLIHAQSEQAIKASLNSLKGSFSKKIKNIIEKLKSFCARLEVCINFPEDVNTEKLLKKTYFFLSNIIFLIKDIYKKAKNGSYLSKGIKIVISGPPNVGKSSLLNALLKKNASIVTHISGTTRDVIKHNIFIKNIKYKLIDTAGLCNSNNLIEKIGIELAKKEIFLCKYIFLVLDVSINLELNNTFIEKFIHQFYKKQKIIILFNKVDLIDTLPKIKKYKNVVSCIFISAKKRIGLENLKFFLNKNDVLQDNIGSLFSARTRHLILLKKTLKILNLGNKSWEDLQSIDILSDYIRKSIQYMCQITGKFTHNDLLEKIFSNFCVGK